MKIVINGAPIPKKRARCACLHGKARAYDPQSKDVMEGIKAEIMSQWQYALSSPQEEMRKEAICLAKAESLEVSLVFACPIPQSLNVGQKNRLLWGLGNHTTKPDLDNLAKLYLDCGTGVLWQDDAKITHLTTKKYFSEKPRTEIHIMAKENLKLNEATQELMSKVSPKELADLTTDMYTMGQYFVQAALDRADSTNGKLAHEELGKRIFQFCHQHGELILKIKKIHDKHARQDS